MNNIACTNFFQRASIIERDYLSALAMKLKIDSYYPQPNLSPFDCIFIKGEITSAIESKVRNYYADDFDTTLIEKGKYDSLMKILQGKLVSRVLYVEFFQKDKMCLIYNLSKIPELEWKSEDFVKNTVVDRGKISKIVGYVPKSLCTPMNIMDELNIIWGR